ncbi:MAG: hypothetical protein ACI8TX_002056 [Hyphomicrobiaceae bacterium]|jgi:hypothetical protein
MDALVGTILDAVEDEVARMVGMERGQLELSDRLLIGEGTVKRCYRHPENPALCVKVCHSEEAFLQQSKEIDYYARLARRDLLPVAEYSQALSRRKVERNLAKTDLEQLCANLGEGA